MTDSNVREVYIHSRDMDGVPVKIKGSLLAPVGVEVSFGPVLLVSLFIVVLTGLLAISRSIDRFTAVYAEAHHVELHEGR